MALIQEIPSEWIADYLMENIDSTNKLLTVAIVLLLLNILSLIGKYLFESFLKQEDHNYERQRIYLEKSQDYQLTAYKKLEQLSGYYQVEESDQYLLLLKEARAYISQHKPFLTSEIEKIATDFLDYSTGVLSDIRAKNIAKETELLNKYCKIFRE